MVMSLRSLVGKALGIAMAMCALAFAAAPAAAEPTSFCESDPTFAEEFKCNPAERIIHVHFTGKVSVLAGGFSSTCNVLVLGDALEPLGAPLVFEAGYNPEANLEDISFSNCSNGCKLEQLFDGIFEFLLTAPEEGLVFPFELFVTISCPILDCTYKAEAVGEFEGPLVAPELGRVVFTEALMKRWVGSFLCPAQAKFDALLIPLKKIYYAE